MSFSEWLDDEMELRGVTNADLMSTSDVSDVNIHRYRKGKSIPRMDTVVKLAYGLGIKELDLSIFDSWGAVKE